MKKIYMTMVALLCSFAAMAQEENGVYVEDIKIDKNVTEFEISVCLRNVDVPAGSISFVLDLPDGIAPVLYDGDPDFEISNSRARKWNGNAQINEAGQPQYAVFNNKSFTGDDGEICTVPVEVSQEVAAIDGTYTIKLIEIGVADAEGVSLTKQGLFPTEASFTLTIGEGTGIHSINADNNNAPVYNVAGQRVSKAQKGVYIQNGKKVAVK